MFVFILSDTLSHPFRKPIPIFKVEMYTNRLITYCMFLLPCKNLIETMRIHNFTINKLKLNSTRQKKNCYKIQNDSK